MPHRCSESVGTADLPSMTSFNIYPTWSAFLARARGQGPAAERSNQDRPDVQEEEVVGLDNESGKDSSTYGV